MEIRLAAPGGAPTALAVLMRTPGHDFELAVGFCITEGLFDDAGQVAEVRYCVGPEGDQEYNIVTIATRGPVAIPERSFVSNASCGVCGKATLDDLEVHCAPVGPGPTFPIDALVGFPDRLRAAQSVFDATGGLHAAALDDRRRAADRSARGRRPSQRGRQAGGSGGDARPRCR